MLHFLLYAAVTFVIVFCTSISLPIQIKADETKKEILYQNNQLLDNGIEPDFNQDIKKISPSEYPDKEVFTNYPDGYKITMPYGLEYDFLFSESVINAKKEDFSCTISIEESTYDDVDYYIEYYQNRFYTNEDFRNKNNLILNEDILTESAGYKTRILTLTKKTDTPYSPLMTYTFAYQYIGERNFVRYLFKGKEFNDEYKKYVTDILNSYTKIKKEGRHITTFKAVPTPNPNWTAETAVLYNKYLTQNGVDWGIFTEAVDTTGINKTIPELEQKIGIPFDIVLLYRHLGFPLPIESLNKIYDSGKIAELTMQVSFMNNEALHGYSPMFDLVEGKLDKEIKELAQQIKLFGKPILFRLNNEMNSDWTSYSGIITLSDPEIYKTAWIRIYNIFEQENVQNAIWVWNPNDNDCPPAKWNNFMCYYPGDKYVQMIGITGYNTGNYYYDVTKEKWREFDDIYSQIYKKYIPYFEKFPWIITEFSTSSYGGDKVKWIENMFKNIHKYPNIKAAVWFSFADYDYRPENKGIAARPYWLDETSETLEAFKKGRHETYKEGISK